MCNFRTIGAWFPICVMVYIRSQDIDYSSCRIWIVCIGASRLAPTISKRLSEFNNENFSNCPACSGNHSSNTYTENAGVYKLCSWRWAGNIGNSFPLFIYYNCMRTISGFHSLVSSGTTPKMLMREGHIKSIAAGAMLVEGLVSILALIASASLFPLDYVMINVPVDKIQSILPQLHVMGFNTSDLPNLSAQVGEKIAGRTCGAVSLAAGMVQIFSSIRG